MGYYAAIHNCLIRFREFKGRASLAEFWWFTLVFFVFLIFSKFVVSAFLGLGLVGSVVQTALFFFLLLCFSSAGFRRLQDAGWPGWLFLVPLTMTLLWFMSFYLLFFAFNRGNADAPSFDLAYTIYQFFNFLLMFTTWATIPAWFVLAFFLSRPSEQGSNKYGPQPALTINAR